MSSDVKQYVPLKQIISYFLDEPPQKSMGDFDSCWVLAFRAMVNLLLDITAEPLTIRILVNGNQTANFPPDYLSWVKIGIMDENGKLSTLKVNNSISTVKDTNPNRLNYLTADVQGGFPFLNSPFFLNYYYNGIYQPLFGATGGLVTYGECRVDEENKVIVFPPDFKYTSILLEYISAPEKSGDYTVPIACQEAVIAYIKWKMKLGTREEYMAEKIDARRRMPKKRVNLQQVNEVIRESRGMKLLS
jgi:hypothetical protein